MTGVAMDVEKKQEMTTVEAVVAERRRLVSWLRAGGPCRLDSGMVYGPWQDALDMVAEALIAGTDGGPSRPPVRSPGLTKAKRDALADHNPDALTFDGLDEAFVGVATRCGQPTLAVYDRETCIDLLHKSMDPTGSERGREEAEEYFEFNVSGAWVGPHTPIILQSLSPEDE